MQLTIDNELIGFKLHFVSNLKHYVCGVIVLYIENYILMNIQRKCGVYNGVAADAVLISLALNCLWLLMEYHI